MNKVKASQEWRTVRQEGHCHIVAQDFAGGHYYNGGRLGSYHAPETLFRVVVKDDAGGVVGISSSWVKKVSPALVKGGERLYATIKSKHVGKMYFDESRAYALDEHGPVARMRL